MKSQAGVWIDPQQAIVVLMSRAGREIKKVKSGIKQPGQPAGGSRPTKKYTPNDFVADDRRERKAADERTKFYDEVLAFLRGAVALLILGPGEAKGELSKQIKTKKLRGLTVELETADRMTDRQVVAKVSEHFAKTPTRKSVAPKKTAKALTGKRPKKTGK
jgi:hypothetical protein